MLDAARFCDFQVGIEENAIELVNRLKVLTQILG